MTKRFFMALALLMAVPALVFAQQSQESLTITVKGVSFKMIRVQGGTFTMGCTSEQKHNYYCNRDEEPAHNVTLYYYYIGESEVTQELWKAVMDSNPSYFKGDSRPVEQVSWNDCQEFIRKLNELTGKKFRLPTEAEWEFAARGGRESDNYEYSGDKDIDAVAWYWGNAGNKDKSNPDYGTHVVKTKKPNELGIYDMSGNVCEWCSDWYGKYPDAAQFNPRGPNMSYSTNYRVLRGGGWLFTSDECRSSCRKQRQSNAKGYAVGLRLVLD